MEIYERPGWAHPSPLANPNEEVTGLLEEVIEEIPVETAPIESEPVEPTE